MWRTDSDWYDHQRNFDSGARLASEAKLGVERRVFGAAMGQLANVLDRAVEQAPYYDLATKRKVPIAMHGFNLLYSAWDSVLAGRYEAAAGHRRSISEVPDLLMAIYVNPAFAEQMKGDSSDIKRARRVFRDALDQNELGTGSPWHQRRLSAAKGIQVFSHVSFEAVSAGFAIGTQENGSKVGALRHGGAPSLPTLRVMAHELASHASELFAVASVTLIDRESAGAIAQANAWSDELAASMRGLSVPAGEMHGLFLLRSTEDPPTLVGIPGVKPL